MKPLTWQSVSSEALQLLKSLPMCQACTCGRVLALAQVQVLQNSGSQMEIQEEKNYREHSNAWYLFFLLWLECLFAKIEDVGALLPDIAVIALHKQASSTSSPGLAVLCCRWAALPWLWPLPAAGFVPLEQAWDGVSLHETSVHDKLQSSNSIRIYLVSIMHLVGLLKSSSRSQRFANSQMIRVWHNRHQHRPPQNYSQCCC